MSACKIITDHKWKNLLYGYQVPEKVKKDYFDWMQEPEIDSSYFIKYRNRYYSLDDFMRIEKECPFYSLGYHGYVSDSYFSGVLVKLSDDGEQYQIALYIS